MERVAHTRYARPSIVRCICFRCGHTTRAKSARFGIVHARGGYMAGIYAHYMDRFDTYSLEHNQIE